MAFNPQQKHKLLSHMGYQGPADPKMMNLFVQSNPGVSAKMGQFERAAGNMLKPQGFAEGGLPAYEPTVIDTTIPQTVTPLTQEEAASSLQTSKETLAGAQKGVTDVQTALAADPENTELQAALTTSQEALDKAKTEYSSAQSAFSTLATPTVSEVTAKAVSTPEDLLKQAEVAKVEEKPEQLIDKTEGQVAPEAPTVETTKVEEVQAAEASPEVTASTIDATQISDEVKQELDDLEAAKGTISPEGTVRGQLEILMEDFEGDGTPPWASGAMRQAMATMQSRGLGASSLAGQAITQAAMESAIAVASQDAKTVAAMEMQNLSNEQQTLIFKSQQRISSMLSDQAADNAAKQFNAASENQTKQFMADLETTVSKFNAEQVNAIRQFNAGQTNATEQFNANMQNMRDQFNAQNSLIIAQANAQWRQNIATTDAAAQNDANLQFAKESNGLTAAALDQIWQRERDLMAFAFTSAESAKDRDVQLAISEIDASVNKEAIDASASAAKTSAILKAIDLFDLF